MKLSGEKEEGEKDGGLLFLLWHACGIYHGSPARLLRGTRGVRWDPCMVVCVLVGIRLVFLVGKGVQWGCCDCEGLAT